MNPPILGFYSNGRQAGKDSAARFTQKWATHHGRTTKRVGFADLGKELAAVSLGVGDADVIAAMDAFKLDGGISVEMTEGLGHTVTGRDFLINLMEGCRSLFGQDFWIDQAFPSPWEPTVDITLVTDVRFMPEIIRLGRLGGKMIEVQNDRAEAPGGRSEGEVPTEYIDWELPNQGTLEEYEQSVFELLDAIYG